MKEEYTVFRQYFFFNYDYPEESHSDRWEYCGKTIASSPEQAVNNVRYRMKQKSQYYPISARDGRYENGWNWRAIRAGELPPWKEETKG